MSETTPPTDPEAASATGYALLMASVEESVQAAADQIATLGRVVEGGFAGMRAMTPPAAPAQVRATTATATVLPLDQASPPSPAPTPLPDGMPTNTTPASAEPLAGADASPTISSFAPMAPAAPVGGSDLGSVTPVESSPVLPPSDARSPTGAAPLTADPTAPTSVAFAPIAADRAPSGRGLPTPLAPIPTASAPLDAAGTGPGNTGGAGGGGAVSMHGDVFLDGVRVGTWMSDHLARGAGSPARGMTGFDPRLGPRWPGALQGG